MKITPLSLHSQHNGGSQRSVGSAKRGKGQPRDTLKSRAKGRGKEAVPASRHALAMNVGDTERMASVIGGSALILYGLLRRSWGGILAALGGGALIARGATGHCNMYQALGVSTAQDRSTQKGVKGIKVEKSVVINRAPEELYQFWRNFENLPHFMHHLESVKVLDDKRSHWVARAPLGTSVEWDAEIIKEEEDHMIAWRSLPNAEVKNAGSVHFERDATGNGTKLKVIVNYEPPAGKLGAAVAKLLGEEPSQQIEEDLNRLKQLMESGPAYH